MSLDARIIDVIPCTDRATIALETRDPLGIPELFKMEILNPTLLPNVGDLLLGDSGSARIFSGGIEYPYKRQAYTKLIQNW